MYFPHITLVFYVGSLRLLSAREPIAQVHYNDHAFSIVVNFSRFRLLLRQHSAEIDDTLQKNKTKTLFTKFVFF